MSEWLRLVNELKRRRPQDHFTAAQQRAYDALAGLLEFPNQRINLCGPSGSGKTYIAWGLVQAFDAVHVPNPHCLRSYHDRDLSILIIDNAPTYEDDIRTLLAEGSLLDAGTIVFVTQKPAALRMRQVYLDLPTPDDVRHIARTFSRLGFYEQHTSPSSPNLWQLLQCYV